MRVLPSKTTDWQKFHDVEILARNLCKVNKKRG